MRNKKDFKYKHYAKDNIVTTLDSILDTRLGLLYAINEDIAEDVLESGLYHNRIRDNFGPISQDVFKSFYRFRTKDLLKYSIQTVLTRDVILPYLRAIMEVPQKRLEVQPILFINIYPYDLTEGEQKRIRIVIANILRIATEFVITVNLDYNEFNSKWVNDNAHNIVMYDGVEWLEYQTAVSDLEKNPLIGAKLITPLILTGPIQIGEITEDKIKSIIEFYGLLIDIDFIDPSFFCFQERPNKPPKKEGEESGESESIHKSTDEGKDKGTN